MRTASMAASASLLLLAACSAADGGADSIELEGSEAGAAAPEGMSDETPDDAGADDAADPDAGVEGADDGAEHGSNGDVVDGAEAIPGTWAVGDAGTITFDVVDGALVLEDVSPAEGWTVTDQEESPEEVEVDFQRGDVEIEIEIELTSGGSVLEIEIDTDVDNAEPGTYEIGDAGSFTFDIVDGSLELTDLTVTDGWEITEEEVEGDELEIELRNGAMRWDADVDLNGSAEVELDYEVTRQL